MSLPRDESPFALAVRHLPEDMRGERPRLLNGVPVFPPSVPPIGSWGNARTVVTALPDELWQGLADDRTPAPAARVLAVATRVGAVAPMAAEDLGLAERG